MSNNKNTNKPCHCCDTPEELTVRQKPDSYHKLPSLQRSLKMNLQRNMRRRRSTKRLASLSLLPLLACILFASHYSTCKWRFWASANTSESTLAFQNQNRNCHAPFCNDRINRNEKATYPSQQRPWQTDIYKSLLVSAAPARHRCRVVVRAQNNHNIALPEEAQYQNIPQHVAIICDGNSRWAQARGLPSSFGHAAGADQLVKMVDALRASGVQYCSFYAFSTENWKRPPQEIHDLLRIMEETCRRFHPRMMRERIRVKVLGDLEDERIPPGLRTAFQTLVRDTAENTAVTTNGKQEQQEPFTICFALNYGGRNDIVQASLQLAERIAAGDIDTNDVNEELFSSFLCTRDIPDPDLIIRTSGECRLSNFMLWNAAYAELYFTDVLWPDFDKYCWQEALEWYSQRQRKFGGRHPLTAKERINSNARNSENGIAAAAATSASHQSE